MPNFDVDCEGIIDRIGIDKSSIKVEFDDEKVVKESEFKNHEQGIALLLEILEENNLISNKE